MSGRRHSDCRGFTLIEVTIVTAVVSVLTLLIVEALADLSRSQAYTRGQSRLGEVSDRVMRAMVKDVTYSVRVFSDGLEGDAYLAALDYPDEAVVGDSRLPALIDKGYFAPDPEGELETGNLLCLARYQKPVTVSVQSGLAAPRTYRIDTTNFVIYYLRRDAAGALDLARWGSVPVASYGDLMVITDPVERTQALAQLYGEDVLFVWDRRADPAQALFEVSPVGVMTPLVAGAKIPADPTQRQDSIVGSLRARVAANGRIGGHRAPAFAQPGPTGFPGGFELKVDGPSTGKIVLLRLLLRAGRGNTRDNFAEVRRVVSCRDG